MGNIANFARHARASAIARAFFARDSSSFLAAKAANTSSVIDLVPFLAARATTAGQCPDGIPRVRQPLTTDFSSPSASATAPVPPRAVMIESAVIMEGSIVRAARTCQALTKRETTFRAEHVQIPSMEDDQSIARRLIAVREHFGLSQVEFAESLHIAKNTLNGYEKGNRSLTMETAQRIRKRYGISTDWLLYGDIGQPSQSLIIALGPSPGIKNDAKNEAVPDRSRAAS
jgi:transcriptional regulator with XRE-family HTH domain